MSIKRRITLVLGTLNRSCSVESPADDRFVDLGAREGGKIRKLNTISKKKTCGQVEFKFKVERSLKFELEDANGDLNFFCGISSNEVCVEEQSLFAVKLRLLGRF
jgi:hypothetical protein